MNVDEPLAKALRHLERAAEGKTHLTLHETIGAVGTEGPSLAAALLTLPFLQPIPLIGISTPIGLTISLLGWSLLLERKIVLPKRLAEVKLPVTSVLKTTEYLRSFKIKLKPYLNSNDTFISMQQRRVIGAAIAVHGFLLALPLPIPFSNMIPAWLCLLGALAVLFSSRRLYLLSIAVICLNFAYWTAIAIGTAKGSSALVKWLGTLF